MNPKSDWSPRVHYLDTHFTEKELFAEVDKFISKQSQYDVLMDYYLGKHEILERQFLDPSKPNNKSVHNFAKLIVDTNSAYFMGNPVTYVSKHTETLEEVIDVLTENDNQDVDAELAKLCCIFGHAFEFHYIDRDGNHRFKYRSPRNVLAIYSADMEEELIVAVNISTKRDLMTDKLITYLEVYTKDDITLYRKDGDGDYKLVESKPHAFDEVPVIEFTANDERQGEFENVISLIDAYNKVCSDSVNDVEYWNDAYLLLRDLQATTMEDISSMKRNRVLMVDGTGDASFISKSINDKHVENVKNRLILDIHKMANTPDLSSDTFTSNLSGTAIRYKMLTLENRTSIKERKFKIAMKKRLKLLLSTLKKRTGKKLENSIDIVFVRSIPANLVEIADVAVKLRNIVSDETLRSQLIPFILDVEQESELVREQRKEEMRMELFPNKAKVPNDGMNEHNLKLKKSSEAEG
jgi:phage portal protein, SPP1 family